MNDELDLLPLPDDWPDPLNDHEERLFQELASRKKANKSSYSSSLLEKFAVAVVKGERTLTLNRQEIGEAFEKIRTAELLAPTEAPE